MRLSATLLALLAAASLAACSGNSGNSGSSSTDTSAPAGSAAPAASAAAAGGSAMSTEDIPDYPGASKMASGGSAAGAGTVETTADPVAKVADFYKGKLSGANETTVKGPTGDATVFTMGDISSGTYSTVTIASMAGKTSITIAKVKKQ